MCQNKEVSSSKRKKNVVKTKKVEIDQEYHPELENAKTTTISKYQVNDNRNVIPN